MDSSTILLVFWLMLAGGSCKYQPGFGTYQNDDQNSLSPLGSSGRHISRLGVSQQAPTILKVPRGQRVELICEVYGNPSPTAQWFKDHRPVTSAKPPFEVTNSDSSYGKVLSTYVIDCAMPKHQGKYVCWGSEGLERIPSTPTTLILEDNKFELSPACDKRENSLPRIVVIKSWAFETEDYDVAFPCVAQGNPRPNIYWVSPDEKIIGGERDSHYKILESGSLVISKAQWTDMGAYTCVAENIMGRDEAQTFFYPFKSN